MNNIFRILGFISHHPLTSSKKLSAYIRFFRWQVGSRLLKEPVLYPFVENTRLFATNGLTGASGVIYVGLVELSEMALALHYLRQSDVFVDVGANIGTYTLLASGVVGARSIAIEPTPQTCAYLMDNITINRLNHIVRVENMAAGSQNNEVLFTTHEGAVNHVVALDELKKDTISVSVKPLDSIVGTEAVSMLKIDVEGFETEVVSGAKNILSNPKLNVVIMELRGHGSRYGFDEMKLHNKMLDYGFQSCSYDPFVRSLNIRNDSELGDMIYVRDISYLRERINTAQKFLLNTRDKI